MENALRTAAYVSKVAERQVALKATSATLLAGVGACVGRAGGRVGGWGGGWVGGGSMFTGVRIATQQLVVELDAVSKI